MADTIVNTGTPTTGYVERDSGFGWALAVILLVVAALAVLYFVGGIGRAIGGASVSVPRQVNVNVQPGNGGSSTGGSGYTNK